jgi:hypothetical protein
MPQEAVAAVFAQGISDAPDLVACAAAQVPAHEHIDKFRPS